MEDAARNKKIDEFLKEVKERIIFLTSTVKTGKCELTLEMNLSQGAIGDTYLTDQTRRKI
jgi:D-serine deaminase-like pyridoxal phosphate-dependent protein